MAKELDSEMTDEQRERMEKRGMGTGVGGINVGSEELFGACGPEPLWNAHLPMGCAVT